jgi:signal recognition particle receptor subunit beta
MVLFNYSTKELTAKVVYYGPGLCGKTTNLQWVHEKLPIRNKGKMLSLATETDRTLFFDFLPIELGTIRGMKTRIQLYTVPGQVFYNATRRMVLKGADCVVFVCDSQEAMLDANLESLENMRQNLEANEINPDEMPMVLQYNKRDLPNALPIEILNERLNGRGVPFFEAVAVKGQGVEETLKGATGLVFRSLAAKYGGADTSISGAGAAAAPAVVARPAPPSVPTGTAPGVTTDPRVAPPRPVLAPRPAAPSPAPIPRVASAPPATASPLPPLKVTEAASRDELLESLELQPAAEMDDLLPEAPELGGMDPEGIPTDESEEIETVDLDQALGAPPPPPPAPQTEAQKAKTTLVSGPKETEDLRRRISRPQFPELSFDDVDQEEDIEELTFEPEVVSPPIAASPARVVVPTPSQAVSRMETLPPGTRAAPPVARPEPPPAPVSVSAPRVLHETSNEVATTAPVSVQLPGAHGQTDVSIPVEVTLGRGSAQVTVHLRLTLNLNLQP